MMNLRTYAELSAALDGIDVDRTMSVHWSAMDDWYTVNDGRITTTAPLGTWSHRSFLRSFYFFCCHLFYAQHALHRGFARWYRIGNRIARAQNRVFDLDLLRHVFTADYLMRRLPLERIRTVVVIGDGFANMAALLRHYPAVRKVVLVNLSKPLRIDAQCLEQLTPGQGYALLKTSADTVEFLADPKIVVGCIVANNARLLVEIPFDLCVNIYSMMEMDIATVEDYFRFCRAAPGGEKYFYCCQRRSKTLADGQILAFANYPWQHCESPLDEGNCPWARTQIHFRYYVPYRKPLDVVHSLRKFRAP